MITVGFLVRIEAQLGKEAEMESLLKDNAYLVEQEPDTKAWFVFKIGPSTYGIFDVFANEEDRQAHLDAAYAKLIRSKPELLTLSIELAQR